jgi:Flp pilus assembly protein TadD
MTFSTLSHAHRRSATLVLIAATVLLSLGSGCKTQTKRVSKSERSAPTTNRAADSFDTAANRPPTPHTLYALARILASQERYTESLNILRGIISDQPNYVPAYNAMAEVQLRTGQLEEAVTTLNAGLKRAPHDAVLLNNLGMVWFLQERYDTALPYFEHAASVKPEVAMYRANQAASLGMLGRTREANDLYRTIMSPSAADENIDILNNARKRAREAHSSAAIKSNPAPGAASSNSSDVAGVPPAVRESVSVGGADVEK